MYVGLDLSYTGTGIVLLDDEGLIFTSKLISSSKDEGWEKRILSIFNEVIQIVIDSKIQMINIEGLAFGKRVGKILEIGGLHYYFRARFTALKIPYIVTPPSQLKKYVIGSQPRGKGSKKELMLLHTFKRWSITFNDNNLCDAFGLAMMIYEKDKPIKEMIEFQDRIKRVKRT